MAEFLTMQEAEDKFGKKGRTNAALTLGIIGTALGAFAGNNNGCGCGGGNGILGGLFGESAQLIEFNVSLPCGARASVAPVSTLTITQRWAKVINTATTGAASYMQVTKFDIIHNTQYTDCKGNVRLVTEETSTILASPATSETITTLVPEVNKVIDVIIPNGVSIVNQAILDELPTSLPVKGNCAYSVFEIQIPAA